MTKRIIVTPRSNDYHAHLAPTPAIWAAGKTPNAAIGDLINTHPEEFGVEIIIASNAQQAEIISDNTPPREPLKPGHKWVKNLLGGKWVQIPENTPLCCDPSSETYHCM